ncbi:sodA [Symbiodinium sp. KB8]|nr:sodA [Symbiodinium sp. KB8]
MRQVKDALVSSLKVSSAASECSSGTAAQLPFQGSKAWPAGGRMVVESPNGAGVSESSTSSYRDASVCMLQQPRIFYLSQTAKGTYKMELATQVGPPVTLSDEEYMQDLVLILASASEPELQKQPSCILLTATNPYLDILADGESRYEDVKRFVTPLSYRMKKAKQDSEATESTGVGQDDVGSEDDKDAKEVAPARPGKAVCGKETSQQNEASRRRGTEANVKMVNRPGRMTATAAVPGPRSQVGHSPRVREVSQPNSEASTLSRRAWMSTSGASVAPVVATPRRTGGPDRKVRATVVPPPSSPGQAAAKDLSATAPPAPPFRGAYTVAVPVRLPARPRESVALEIGPPNARQALCSGRGHRFGYTSVLRPSWPRQVQLVRATQAAACHCHAVLLRTIAVPPAASAHCRIPIASATCYPAAERSGSAGAALLRRAAACNPAAATEFHGRARRTCRQGCSQHSTDPTGPPEGLQAPSKTTLRRGKLANTVGRAAPKQDRPAAGSTADLAGATARPQTAAAGAAAAAGRSNCMYGALDSQDLSGEGPLWKRSRGLQGLGGHGKPTRDRALNLGEAKELLKAFREIASAKDFQKTLGNIHKQGSEAVQRMQPMFVGQSFNRTMAMYDFPLTTEGYQDMARGVSKHSWNIHVKAQAHEVERLLRMPPGAFFGIPGEPGQEQDFPPLPEDEPSKTPAKVPPRQETGIPETVLLHSALKIAQGLDMAELAKAETGLTYLIDPHGGTLADVNAELKLPDLILSEQLLNNQKLMIRTDDLLEISEASLLDTDLGMEREQDDDAYGYMGQEEHMAFLTESVLDLEDPEACEYAAEIVQSQEEAYNAGQNKGAQWLPRAALRALWELHPPPEVSQVAGAEGQDDLQKVRGDAVCPLQKGKGKGRDRPPGHLRARGQKIGRYKHSTYDVAYLDENYRKWVIGNIDEKQMMSYCLEAFPVPPLSKGLPGEHAAYVLQDKQHGLQGKVIGTKAMDKVMDEIIKEFKFGALEFGDKFDYCRRTVEQGENGITVTCPNNAATVRPIFVGADRKKQKGHYMTEQERNQLRSILALGMHVKYEAFDIRAVLYGMEHGEGKPDLIKATDARKFVMMTDCKSLEQHLRQPGLHTVGDKCLALQCPEATGDLPEKTLANAGGLTASFGDYGGFVDRYVHHGCGRPDEADEKPAAISKFLGRDEILRKGRLVQKKGGVYSTYKDDDPIGDVRQVLVLGADLRTVEDQEDDQPPPIHPYAAQPKAPVQSPNEGSRAGVDSYSVPRRREGLEPPPRAKESAYPSADPPPAPPKPPEPKPTPKKAAPPPKPKPPPPPQQYEIRIRHAVEAGPEITLTIWTNWTFDAVREALAKKLGRDDIRRKARFVFKASAGTSPWIAFKDQETVGWAPDGSRRNELMMLGVELDDTELENACAQDDLQVQLEKLHDRWDLGGGIALQLGITQLMGQAVQKATELVCEKFVVRASDMATTILDIGYHVLRDDFDSNRGLPELSVQQVIAMQRELHAGFADPAFQRRLDILENFHAKDPKLIPMRQELFLSALILVQSKVLPKYGFQGSLKGVFDMLEVFRRPDLQHNGEFVRLGSELNSLLRLMPDGRPRPTKREGGLRHCKQAQEREEVGFPNREAMARRVRGVSALVVAALVLVAARQCMDLCFVTPGAGSSTRRGVATTVATGLASLIGLESAKAYDLPDLPYAYDALEPSIDKATMEFHHDKHHLTYVTNINKALKDKKQPPLVELQKTAIKDGAAFRNSGGGAYNHNFFWLEMAPTGTGGSPSEKLSSAIDASFGSMDDFKAKFEAAGAPGARFGSGWVWLVVTADKKLAITSTPNQDNPLMEGVEGTPGIPILGCDVWEHAYYLKYQYRRPDYIKAWWNVVNWKQVSAWYEGAMGGSAPTA